MKTIWAREFMLEFVSSRLKTLGPILRSAKRKKKIKQQKPFHFEFHTYTNVAIPQKSYDGAHHEH